MIGGSVEVSTDVILYWFIEGQAHFGLARCAKTSEALNGLK